MDFPDDPVLKNLPCNAGEVGSILGQGARSQVVKQLSPHTTMKDTTWHTELLCAATKTQRSQINKQIFFKKRNRYANLNLHLCF